jgi:predicted glycoside hydrolase/deacetylase ChbG (UPF0249 family)
MIAGCSSATAFPLGRIALHADDLGMSRAVTEGILRGFRDGPLTSTSLLANAPDAGRALGRWKDLLGQQRAGTLPSGALRRKLHDDDRPFDLGIHLNLTAGCPLTTARYPAELLDGRGQFPGIFSLFQRIARHGRRCRAAVREELARQVQFVLDHGLQPTHLNGHQYVELLPTIRGVVEELLEKFHVRVVRVAAEPSLWPVVFRRGLGPSAAAFAAAQQFFARQFGRRMMRGRAAHADVFFGTALAGRMEMGRLRAFLDGRRGQFPDRGELIEICLHPAEADGTAAVAGWHDPLAALRPQELEMLVSAELAEYLLARDARLGRLSRLADP